MLADEVERRLHRLRNLFRLMARGAFAFDSPPQPRYVFHVQAGDVPASGRAS